MMIAGEMIHCIPGTAGIPGIVTEDLNFRASERPMAPAAAHHHAPSTTARSRYERNLATADDTLIFVHRAGIKNSRFC